MLYPAELRDQMRQARIKKTFLRVQRYKFDHYKQIYYSILFLKYNFGLIKIQKNIGIVDGVKNFF
jgi:hypothetical protein